MTANQEAIDYWRTRALAAEKVIADAERMGCILPHTYQELLEQKALWKDFNKGNISPG